MTSNTFRANGHRRVLVVEDDLSVRRMLRMVFKAAGVDITEAGTGTEALARLGEGGVSGVVLDLGLPDSRSGDVLQWLHSHGERPPWLVISARDRGEVIRMDASIRGRFISKPFDPWALLERVKTLISEN